MGSAQGSDGAPLAAEWLVDAEVAAAIDALARHHAAETAEGGRGTGGGDSGGGGEEARPLALLLDHDELERSADDPRECAGGESGGDLLVCGEWPGA